MHPQTHRHCQNHQANAGFSMVELLVGAAIAMIIFLVISFVFANFENQKRVTTVGSDTQSNGTMAIADLEQAIKSAGAGMVSGESFQCSTAKSFSYYNNVATSTVTSPVPGYSANLAPIVITDGGSGGSDSIDIRVGAPVDGAAATQLTETSKITDTTITVKRGSGISTGKVVLLVGPNQEFCQVVEITSVPDATRPNVLSIAPGTGNTWNPDSAYKTGHGWPSTLPANTSVYTPGAMAFRTYSINASRQLQALNQVATAAASTDILAGDIASMQAQYGVSAAVGSQDVANWVEPTGAWAAAAIDADHAMRIKAVRVVIILRSPKLENSNVTGTCVNNAGTNNGPCAWQDSPTDHAPLIDLSGFANWQRYRYRVFQTVIPLRNVIWAGV